VVKNGQLTPLVASSEAINWNFSAPLAQQAMVELPFSEIITISRHLSANTVRSFLNRSALDDIRDGTTPAPVAIDEIGRSAQQFEMVVRLAQGGQTKTAGVRGQDIYAVTAPIVVEAAQQLLAPAYAQCGAMPLAQAVNPLRMLAALDHVAFELSSPQHQT
jgi:hypothetical protein